MSTFLKRPRTPFARLQLPIAQVIGLAQVRLEQSNSTTHESTNIHYKPVTCQDLQNFVRQETTIDEINKVVTAGLQGRKEYNGQPLRWKVTTDTQKCKVL